MNSEEPTKLTLQQREELATETMLLAATQGDHESAAVAYLTLQKAILLRKLNGLLTKEGMEAIALTVNQINEDRKSAASKP